MFNRVRKYKRENEGCSGVGEPVRNYDPACMQCITGFNNNMLATFFMVANNIVSIGCYLSC